MCKICEDCQGIMNYDPYFEAEVCSKCGRIEREKSKETILFIEEQTRNIDSLRRVLETVAVQ